MRIADRYISKQVFLGTLYAVLVLSLVLGLGKLFQDVRSLLVDQRVPLLLVIRFVVNVMPSSLIFTIPWGFLSAVLLVFGRMSSDQEVTAFRVSGMSLWRLSVPVFAVGALFSGVSLWLNSETVPKAKDSVRQMIFEQAARDPASLLKPGVVNGELSSDQSIKVLIEEKDGEWVRGFHLFQFRQVDDEDQATGAYIHAARTSLKVLHDTNQLRAKLENAYFETYRADGTVEVGIAGEAEPLLIDLKDRRVKRLKANSLTNSEIHALLDHDETLDAKKRRDLRTEIVKRQTFSLATLAFAFIAVPLGLKSRRRDTSRGLFFSVLIGSAYFLITMLVDQFETETAISLALWAPNILCVLLGMFLFRRARFK